jgi:hypothetical protein
LSQKKNYSRSFIILQENEKGHGISSDKLPTGYAKIELKNGKCKVSYYIQNLKKVTRPYHMILICNKKEVKKLIKFGEISLDQDGKAEASKEFEDNNIVGSGISTDKVIGAAIVQFIDKDMVVVMSGFNASDIPDSWKSYSIVGDTNKQKTEVEVKKEVTIETRPEHKKENKTEIKEEVKTEVKVEKERETKKPDIEKEGETKKPDVEKERETKKLDVEKEIEVKKSDVEEEVEVEKTDKEDVVKEEDRNIFDQYEKDIEESKIETNSENIRNNIEEEKSDSQEKIEEEILENENCDREYYYQNAGNYPIGKMGGFFRNLASDFEDLGEYFPDVSCCRWYRVPLDGEEEYDYSERSHNKHALIYYPMMAYYPYIQKNGYYMLGYKYDKDGKMKYIVYGILGTKSRYDQPFRGRTGFVSWVPLERGNEEEDSKGCWLMFYDFKNAAILVPRRKENVE